MVLILDGNSEQSLLLDLVKAIDEVENSLISNFFSLIFLHAGAICSELPSKIRTVHSLDPDASIEKKPD